jgi:hypothetical protein
MLLQAMQSKPGSRSASSVLDLRDEESGGGRECTLIPKLMDDDDGHGMVRSDDSAVCLMCFNLFSMFMPRCRNFLLS